MNGKGTESIVAFSICLCCLQSCGTPSYPTTYVACFPRGNTQPFCYPPLYPHKTHIFMTGQAMDVRDSVNLEWESLALYNNFQQYTLSYDDHHLISTTTAAADPIIGLHLGTHKHNNYPSSSTKSSTPTPTKRSRASYHNMQNPCCQVEGCNLDLKSAKDYHRRHRICETHSKTPRVIVAGKERRFCQQCSRFHDLSEFDDKKRSCRRRLSDHNARRRRVQPESIQLNSAALYAEQRQQNVLLSGLPISLSNSTWDHNAATRHALSKPPRAGTLNDIHNSISNLHMEPDKFPSLHPSNLDQCIHVAGVSPSMAPDLVNAHSLLSTNAWGLHDGGDSTEGLVAQGNYGQVMRHGECHDHLSLFHQGPHPVFSMQDDEDDDEASPHHQEYHLFKSPYDDSHHHPFYSSQRYL